MIDVEVLAATGALVTVANEPTVVIEGKSDFPKKNGLVGVPHELEGGLDDGGWGCTGGRDRRRRDYRPGGGGYTLTQSTSSVTPSLGPLSRHGMKPP